VSATVTAKVGERTLFLAEAVQAGIFQLRNVPPDDLRPLLGIACPTILFPYLREAISDLVTRGGFPPVHLAPVSFEALYVQRLQQEQSGAPKVEVAR
jgi:preprotein translocase subunit SecB